MKNKFPTPRKPSTLIAAAIKQEYYFDADNDSPKHSRSSQFMCHAIQGLEYVDSELVERTADLIENKLIKLCLEARVYETITLYEVLKRTEGNGDENYNPSFERMLKFWKDFIKELKELNQ